MKLQLDKKSSTLTILNIQADKEEILKAKEASQKELSKNVKVDGFRSGKAPIHIAIDYIDPGVLLDNFFNRICNELINKALGEQSITAVLQPEVEIIDFKAYQSLEIKVTVYHLGKIEIADYFNFKKILPKIEISDKEFDSLLESLRQNKAVYKKVDRQCRKGDRLTLDFSAYDNNKLIPGTKAVDYKIILGQNQLVQGFEEQLEGKPTSEEFKIDITFPKDYIAKGLREKKTTFTILIKLVEEVILPELNDKFAKEFDGFPRAEDINNMEDLKSRIKQEFLIKKTRQTKLKTAEQILVEISEKSIIEIPEKLIKQEAEDLKHSLIDELKNSNLTLEDWLSDMGETEKEHQDKLINLATERIKYSCVVTKIAANENMKIGQDEIMAEALRNQNKDILTKDDLSKEILEGLMAKYKLGVLTNKVLSYFIDILLVEAPQKEVKKPTNK